MSQERFEKILHDKLYDLETDQKVPSWHDMQRRMNLSERASGVSPRTGRRRWMAYSAVAALLALMLGTGLHYYRTAAPEMVAETYKLGDTLDMTLPGIDQAVSVASIEAASQDINSTLGNLFKTAKSVTVLTTAQRNPLHTTDNEPTLVEGFDIKLAAESLLADDLSVRKSKMPEKQNNPQRSNTVRAHNDPSAGTFGGGFNWDRYAQRREQRNNWQLSAFTNTFASSDKSGNSGRFDTPRISAMVNANYLHGGRLAGMKLRHHFPISVGLGVKKHFNDRWALETGLVYSYLESSGEKEEPGYLYKARQQVHYLGLPLYASYSLFNNNRWDVYLSGGFMTEVALSAQSRIRMYIDGDAQSTSYDDLKPKGLLWSTTMGGGVTYYMVDKFGVYLEPGASYYFSNDRQPLTYRTEHPWSFNVRLGFRVKF